MSIVELTADITPGVGDPSGDDAPEASSGDWDVSEVDPTGPREEPEARALRRPADGVRGRRHRQCANRRHLHRHGPAGGRRNAPNLHHHGCSHCVRGQPEDDHPQARRPRGARCSQGRGRRVANTCRGVAGSRPASGPVRTGDRTRSAPSVRASEATQAAAEPDRGRPAQALRQVQNSDSVTIPRDRWDDLRLRLARAEAEAAERALALADARLALRALTAGPHPGPAELTGPSSASPALAAQVATPQSQDLAGPTCPTCGRLGHARAAAGAGQARDWSRGVRSRARAAGDRVACTASQTALVADIAAIDRWVTDLGRSGSGSLSWTLAAGTRQSSPGFGSGLSTRWTSRGRRSLR